MYSSSISSTESVSELRSMGLSGDRLLSRLRCRVGVVVSDCYGVGSGWLLILMQKLSI